FSNTLAQTIQLILLRYLLLIHPISSTKVCTCATNSLTNVISAAFFRCLFLGAATLTSLSRQ
ncbi:hypothetical protein, partial [Crocosphaera sp. Alani8]|uniref:hypothetical protein n=1 Tax=Crocosphaera sp. Alani8 TaxID=3038952 RepID=UPI00313BCDA7